MKNVSPELAQALTERAARHRRSLQGELTVILERAAPGEESLSVDEAFERIRRLRELRDSR